MKISLICQCSCSKRHQIYRDICVNWNVRTPEYLAIKIYEFIDL